MHIRLSQGLAAAIFVALMLAAGAQAPAQTQRPDLNAIRENRPYDADLFKISEILGAAHYLRELCHAGEGQLWRQQMNALVNAEGTTARRRAHLVKLFNKGYRSYKRTHRKCTEAATLAIARFMKEGAALADKIVRKNK